mgnify:CR=1 FL=1
MIYLHKILPLIFSPLFFCLFLITLGIFLRSKKISLSGVILIIFCSLPVVSNNLIYYLEKDYKLQKPSEINPADAIVVLSGMVQPVKTNQIINYEFSGSVDRILAGIELYKTNRASTLVLTRGKVPWSVGMPEGEYLKEFAIRFGIPEQNILLTSEVQNTDQEAKAVKNILPDNQKNIILVTSAFHMPRAIKVFDAAGLKSTAFAVDFKVPAERITLMSFLPSAVSFQQTSFFVREMIGRAYYHLKY